MIGFLQGQVFSVQSGEVTVGVGSANSGWVGYLVSVPSTPAYELLQLGSDVKLQIQTHGRKDVFELELFGFLTLEEKQFFQLLCTVNGIGPRTAMGILGKADPQTLATAIANEDVKALTALPGIGKKSAERLVLELSDKVRKQMKVTSLGAPTAATSTSGLQSKSNQLVESTRMALLGLGYRDSEIRIVIEDLFSLESGAPSTIGQAVTAALKRLGSAGRREYTI